MRIFVTLGIITIIIFVFSNCSSSKKLAATPKLTYETDLKAVIQNNCSPCHFPPKGNKKPFDSYANVQANIDEMIRRIELNPTDKGFMPFKKPKLNDSTIAVFKKWRADGLLEK
jgi:hypothetical protein